MNSLDRLLSAVQSNNFLLHGSNFSIHTRNGEIQVNVKEIALNALVENPESKPKIHQLVTHIGSMIESRKLNLNMMKNVKYTSKEGKKATLQEIKDAIQILEKNKKDVEGLLLGESPAKKRSILSILVDKIYAKFHSIMGFKSYREKRQALSEMKESITELRTHSEDFHSTIQRVIEQDLKKLERLINAPLRTLDDERVGQIEVLFQVLRKHVTNVKQDKLGAAKTLDASIQKEIEKLEVLIENTDSKRRLKEIDVLLNQFHSMRTKLNQIVFSDPELIEDFRDELKELKKSEAKLFADILFKDPDPVDKAWRPYIHRGISHREAKKLAEDTKSVVIFEKPNSEELLLIYKEREHFVESSVDFHNPKDIRMLLKLAPTKEFLISKGET